MAEEVDVLVSYQKMASRNPEYKKKLMIKVNEVRNTNEKTRAMLAEELIIDKETLTRTANILIGELGDMDLELEQKDLQIEKQTVENKALKDELEKNMIVYEDVLQKARQSITSVAKAEPRMQRGIRRAMSALERYDQV